MKTRNFELCRLVTALAASGLLALAGASRAQVAGEVEFSRGVGFAQSQGQGPRALGRGLNLFEGDRLTTTEGAIAIVRFQDGTRMTLRPNSELVVQQFQYRGENAPGNTMVMQLLRGGLRAVTGLIARSSQNAARIQTNTATIGIRGTDFDARLCSRDCGAEAARVAERPRPNAVQASARVIAAQGEVSAVDGAGQRRRLVDGAPVYAGDLVETAAGTRAVLAFRDESRIALGASTRFRVDNFVFDERNPGDGRFLVSVLRGSVRALTGLIARANQRNVGFSTATATIGIRGTGFDLICTGACAGEPGDGDAGLTLFAWLGSITVTPSGQTALQVLQAGQGLLITPSGVRPIVVPPALDTPRPDGVTPPPRLFSGEAVGENEEGLFVFVRDGHIEVATAREVLHLGRGEAGHADGTGSTRRPTLIPRFIDFDPVPLPTSRNPMVAGFLGDLGLRPANQCR